MYNENSLYYYWNYVMKLKPNTALLWSYLTGAHYSNQALAKWWKIVAIQFPTCYNIYRTNVNTHRPNDFAT